MDLAAAKRPLHSVRLALALWVAWALIVWNVVFDHVVEVAGRQYLHAAGLAAQTGTGYVRIDDWMRPAVTSGLWTASLSAAAIVVVGLTGILTAAARLPPSAEWSRPGDRPQVF
jgi:hypothetical protein